jgi:adenylosuccinate lyase
VLTALIESGMTRDDAYRVVQRNAQRAWDEQRSFRELLEADPDVSGRLDTARLDELFDHDRFVRHAPAIIDRLNAL